MKICFISRFDSFVSLALNYAILFRGINWEVEFVVIDPQKLDRKFFSRVKENLEEKQISLLPYNSVIFEKNTVIFFSLTGGYIRKLFRENYLLLNKETRPYLISAYPGVVYQNILDGFSSRSFCDLILLPSKRELECYNVFADKYNLDKTGFVGGYFKKKDYGSQKFEKDIVFAEQTVVPKTATERLYLAKKLIELAHKDERRKLYIKPRVPLGGDSLFKTKLHIIEALNLVSKQKIPENLIITFEPIEYFTSQGASCMTISSTGAIETLQFHEKIIFITDFGPSENNGASYFHDSGVEYKFFEVLAGISKKINLDWREKVYCSAEEQFVKIIEKIREDLKNKKRLGIRNARLLFSEEYLQQERQQIPKTFSWYNFIKEQLFRFLRKLNFFS